MPQSKNEELVRHVRLADFVRVRRGGRAVRHACEVPTKVDADCCDVVRFSRWCVARYDGMVPLTVERRLLLLVGDVETHEDMSV